MTAQAKLQSWERTRVRNEDFALIDRVLDSRIPTMTEKRWLRRLRDEVSSDIVHHYVMTDEERAKVRRLLEASAEILPEKNRTEHLVELVYRIRHDQDRGYHGYHGHVKEVRNTIAEWTVYLLRTAATPAGVTLREFRNLMLDTAAVAVSAAEWAEKKLGEKPDAERV